MAWASMETTLELWASSLREVKTRIRPLFTQERVAASAGLFLDGLLGDERRKSLSEIIFSFCIAFSTSYEPTPSGGMPVHFG